MHAEDGIDIAAPADVVWRIYADVERWPEWTESVTEVDLGGEALAVGASARIRQPKLPRATWVVTELTPGRSWSWEARSPGAVSVGHHRVTPTADGTSRAELSIDQSGPLGGLVGRLVAGLTRRYLRMEAEGLKAASEAAAASSGQP